MSEVYGLLAESQSIYPDPKITIVGQGAQESVGLPQTTPLVRNTAARVAPGPGQGPGHGAVMDSNTPGNIFLPGIPTDSWWSTIVPLMTNTVTTRKFASRYIAAQRNLPICFNVL